MKRNLQTLELYQTLIDQSFLKYIKNEKIYVPAYVTVIIKFFIYLFIESFFFFRYNIEKYFNNFGVSGKLIEKLLILYIERLFDFLKDSAD